MNKWLLLEIQNPLESNIKNSTVADEHEVWETVLLEKICSTWFDSAVESCQLQLSSPEV